MCTCHEVACREKIKVSDGSCQRLLNNCAQLICDMKFTSIRIPKFFFLFFTATACSTLSPSATTSSETRSIRRASENNECFNEEIAKNNPSGFWNSNGSKIYCGRRLTLTGSGVPLEKVLKQVLAFGKLSYVSAADLTILINYRFTNVAWDHALDSLLKSAGLEIWSDSILIDKIYRIDTREKFLQAGEERKRIHSASQTVSNPEKPRAKAFKFRNLEVSEVLPFIRDSLGANGSVFKIEKSNSIVVYDEPSRIRRLFTELREIDQPGA